jgi:hypothetical protein
MTAAAWDGATVKCDCGSSDCEYVKDVDHDDGSCEVFQCLACNRHFHVELPD